MRILSVFLLAHFLPCVAVAQNSISGRIDYMGSCNYAAIATRNGYTIALWMGGWLPVTGQVLSGEVERLGMIVVNYDNGRDGSFFVENVYLTASSAQQALAERDCQ